MNAKVTILLLIALVGLSGTSARGVPVSPEERHYRQSAFRSWRYGIELLKTSVDPERKHLEIDLAASSFDYFFLLTNKEIKKNVVIENYIKEIFASGSIRQSIMNDPQNRSLLSGCGAPRASSSGKIITDDEYKILMTKFMDFIKLLPPEAK